MLGVSWHWSPKWWLNILSLVEIALSTGFYLGVSKKIGGFLPKSSHFNRVNSINYTPSHFGGVFPPIFGKKTLKKNFIWCCWLPAPSTFLMHRGTGDYCTECHETLNMAPYVAGKRLGAIGSLRTFGNIWWERGNVMRNRTIWWVWISLDNEGVKLCSLSISFCQVWGYVYFATVMRFKCRWLLRDGVAEFQYHTPMELFHIST